MPLSPIKKTFYTRPGVYDVYFSPDVSYIRVTLVGGGGGGSSIGTAANGENSVVRWFGNFFIAYGGKGGSAVTDYINDREEREYYRYSYGGKGGNFLGRDGKSRSIVNFSPNSEEITISGGIGFNLGNGIEYGSGGDVLATCDPYIFYSLAGGGSGGLITTVVKLGSFKTLRLEIGRGGQGSGFGTNGMNGAALIEFREEEGYL